jgi:dTDP-4-dehydrorhamnose 3,5-epimerase
VVDVKVTPADIPDVLILEPRVFEDARGLFYESYNKRAFREAAGVEAEFVQDNVSRSAKNVLRGLHYQIKRPQGKLVRVLAGEIWDVAVDIRQSSPTFGKWVGLKLSADDKRAIWVPPGFAHGFIAISKVAEVQYKTTDYYAPEHERTIRWDDQKLAIAWPRAGEPILNDRDRRGTVLAEAETYQ